MRMRTKVWLIIAVLLVVIGGILFGGVMSMLKWDFTKLSTSKYENNDYEIHEDYQHISIITNTADIVLAPCKSSTTSVSCYEQKNNMHSVSVKDGTLEIEIVDTRKWYEHIGINFSTPKITVYIPEVFQLSSIDISVKTGDIYVEDASVGSLDLTVSTGETYLTNIRCKNLTSSGSTGDISLNHVIATEKLSIKRDTGDVKFDGSDAAEIHVMTDTGDITGSLLTDKVFIVQTNTGKINVPKTVSGGRCEIHTDTGDIKIAVED